jgi:penicillin-binding protein 2
MFEQRSSSNQFGEERTETNTARIFMVLFRVLMVSVFVLLTGRLYQIQIIRGDTFREDSDDNRFRLVEIPAPRGVMYDKTGQILTRNRPSFEISLVPDETPTDDPDTEVDEEAAEIEKVLRLIGADTDEEVAIRIGELMFRKLGRVDFAETVEDVGVTLDYVLVPGLAEDPFEGEEGEDEENREPPEPPAPILIPDISKPLALEGLVALVQRSVQLGRQGSASEPVPVLDLVDRISAFEIVEESYRIPAIRVNEVPVREYVYGDLISHILGFMGPIPAAVADEYEANGYSNPNERVGLNGLEFSYQRELRGLPGFKNLEVDILGREMRTVGQVIEPVPGSNLILNIDLRLQRAMDDELVVQMEKTEAPWGVSIAMNPQTGAILGMVSLPSYDNNIFAESINEDYLALEQDERRPLINYAIGGLYPPGSTFKMVPATAAIQEKVISGRTISLTVGRSICQISSSPMISLRPRSL